MTTESTLSWGASSLVLLSMDISVLIFDGTLWKQALCSRPALFIKKSRCDLLDLFIDF